jgi:hypothetical protein
MSSEILKLRGSEPSSLFPSGKMRGHQHSEKDWLSSSPSSELRGRAFSVYTPILVSSSLRTELSSSADRVAEKSSPIHTPYYPISLTNGSSHAKRKQPPFPTPGTEALKCMVSSGIVFEDGTSRIAHVEMWSPAWSEVSVQKYFPHCIHKKRK